MAKEVLVFLGILLVSLVVLGGTEIYFEINKPEYYPNRVNSDPYGPLYQLKRFRANVDEFRAVILIFIFTVVYPVRYSYLLTKWAVSTLKEPVKVEDEEKKAAA